MLMRLSITLRHEVNKRALQAVMGYGAIAYVKKAKTTQYQKSSQRVIWDGTTELAITTYGEPLCVIHLAGTEQGLQGVVARDEETSQVGQELTAEVEDDEEEIQSADTDNAIDLRDPGLLLNVDQGRVFGKLCDCSKSVYQLMRNWQGKGIRCFRDPR